MCPALGRAATFGLGTQEKYRNSAMNSGALGMGARNAGELSSTISPASQLVRKKPDGNTLLTGASTRNAGLSLLG